MNTVTVVDARMGRGKTSAAIRYMNEHKHEKRFLYVTPYLTEVGRIRDECGFEEPEAEEGTSSKLSQLKALLHKHRNITTTHAMLTEFMDDEAFRLAESGEYTLILDESIQSIDTVPVTAGDLNIMKSQDLISIDENCHVQWVDRDYCGSYINYKKMADDGGLFYAQESMFHVTGITKLAHFKQTFVLTYLFNGQPMRACLDYFGQPYTLVGIEEDEHGFKFSDEPDAPTPLDYRSLIHIIGEDPDGDPKDARMNSVGDDRTALSVSWYNAKGKSSPEMRRLRGAMQKLARNFGTKTMIWTVYKGNVRWFTDSKKRYLSSFVSLNARATNDYRDATTVAYLANRFINPNIVNFFAMRGVHMSQDDFALSEMLQFIWRSGIRDGRPITLYMPSRRMRCLLTRWISEQTGGQIDLTQTKN